MPKGVHLAMDEEDEDVDYATAVGMARLRPRVGAADRGPATVTDGAALAGEYRSASVGLAAEEKRQYKKEAGSAHGVSGAAIARTQYRSASVGVAAEETSQGRTGQGGSVADFLFTQKRQHEKEAVSAQGVRVAAVARKQSKDRTRRSPTKA